jgi:hypothetical protein
MGLGGNEDIGGKPVGYLENIAAGPIILDSYYLMSIKFNNIV